MIRPTALMFLLIFPSVVLIAQHVEVEVRHPSSCRTGDRCIVDVLITKDDVSGFARFQQILPEGVTAELVDDGGGEFIFERQRVAFIWLRLPEQDQIKVSYRLVFNSAVKGQYELTEGLFSYLQDNRTQRHPLDPMPIALNAAPLPRTAVAESAVAKPVETPAAKPIEKPAATPVETPAAKLIETPAAKLIETPTTKPIETPAAKPIETPAAKPVETPAAKPGETPAAKPIDTPAAKPVETPAAKPGETPAAKPIETPAAKPIETPAAKPVETPAAKPIERPPTQASGIAATSSTVPAVRGGEEYRVQIAALRTLRPVNSVRQQFDLKEEVFVETADGWHRYTFGSFATREAAEAAQKAFIAKNGGNAVVVRYKDGKRQ